MSQAWCPASQLGPGWFTFSTHGDREKEKVLTGQVTFAVPPSLSAERSELGTSEVIKGKSKSR